MKKRTKTRKLSIQAKIILPSSLLILILCTVMGINSYNHIKNGMVEMGVEEARMAAGIAVGMVDGDLIDSIRPPEEEYGSENYMKVLESLQHIQSQCGIEFIYTVYTDDREHLYYGVASDDTADDFSLGDAFDYPFSEFAEVYNGQEYVQDYIDKTEYGNLISSFMPIKDSAGTVIGILGCDYNADNVLERIQAARANVMLISIISMLVSIVLLSIIIQAITRNLNKVDGKIYDLVNSEGDLTQKLDIHTGDELELIADNVNALLEYIREIMLNVSESSTLLSESAHTVVESLSSANSGISDVSANMEEMSATMEQTSASLCTVNETISEIVKNVVNIANTATEESRSSSQISKKVQDIYNTAVREKNLAVRQAEEMSIVVHEKIESSKAVSRISALTDEIINITEQTSLLSLNASIEAARAGESGKGFAIVASEIGTLAMNSANAAEQIQQVSNEVIAAVNELAKEAEKMLHFMNETAMAGYDKLLENSTNYRSDVENMNKTMQNFASESRELRSNIEHIKDSVNELNIAVEENTKSLVSVTEITYDLSASMENINNEADATVSVAGDLKEEVGKFKL